MLRRMPSSVRVHVLSFAAGAAALLAGGLCHAGVTIVFQRGDQVVSTMSIEGPRMRVEGVGSGGHEGAMIIDGAAKQQVILNDVDKSYMVMTPEDMRHARQRMAEVRAQAMQRLKNMPPEERQKLEAVMGKKMDLGGPLAIKPPVIKYEKLGAKRNIAGHQCDTYRVLWDGKPHTEECIVGWNAGVVKKSDFAALRPYVEEAAKASGRADDLLAQLQKAPGFPIARVRLDEPEGRGPEEWLKSVERGPIPADKFEIPSGYTKKDMPTMPAPGQPGGPPRGGPFRPLPPPQPQK
jgi:hypothetical protein